MSPNELCFPIVSQERASSNQLSTRSRAYLQSSCAFPEKDFILLTNQIKSDLRQPSNLVGLVGPQKGKECFETWLVDYMNAGIGAVYWCADKGRIWDYSTDEGKESIRILLRALVKLTGPELRKKGRRSSNIENSTFIITQGTQFSSTGLKGLNDSEDITQEVPAQEVLPKNKQQRKTCLPGASTTLNKATYVQSIWDKNPLEDNAGNFVGVDSNDFVADYVYEVRPYIF
ncbi:uncharacterized protein LAJ45_09918 [Morchella importuna]|uniref:uncharacterized protein n=1 Tax=Morchella importuna TaxID=1174673 RepID=UPI001E8DFB96|nr:uncharacterized protein LAJ45_09918 [Morchella importuna]KAH8145996.1 hypothetical protein LAJ45_09918 [Morchella importuna]